MKVIMLKDVGGVAQRGSVKEVSDGYALNYLIPNGLAVQATDQKIADHGKKQHEAAAAQAAREKEWSEKAAQMNGATIEVHAKANDHGHLYNKLPSTVIESEIKKVFGIALPPDAIIMTSAIKEIGEASVSIKMGLSTAKLKLLVRAE